MPTTRRTALKLIAGSALGAGIAPLGFTAPGLNLKDPADFLTAIAKMRASLDDRLVMGWVIGRRYAVVVGGNDHAVERRNAPHLLIYVLDEELAGLIGERLSRESCGCVTSRNDCDGAQPEGSQGKKSITTNARRFYSVLGILSTRRT